MKHYAVIGHPIGHTMSPFIHKRLFSLSDIDADYGVYDIRPCELKEKFITELSELDGFNVTIPHKADIINCIDKTDEKASMYGSVNTVKITENGSVGYTTDPDGFLLSCENAGIRFEGKIVILGCGGVARIIAYEIALKNRPFHMYVRESSMDKAGHLINEIKSRIKNADITLGFIKDFDSESDLLINATPAGMYPNTDQQIISDKVINRAKSVFDVVYNPLETVLIKKAKANGALALGGMPMLVYQAVAAQKHWNDVSFDRDDIEKICEDASKELMNI